MAKYVFVTGGVVSGLGKGIVAASLGRLLKQRGYNISVQKLDPYLNVDPGTMNPLEHGEVFVTDDGAETDLDLGHYERFIDENITKHSSVSSGQVYMGVLNRERSGGYLGSTIQVIPHITNAIKDSIRKSAEESDIAIVEIGGTTGDIEGQPFIEAIRQLSIEEGVNNCVFIHLTLVPYLSWSKEFKSKPTQHSLKELMSSGIHPNIIVTRSDTALDSNTINKLEMFCSVQKGHIIQSLTVNNLYRAPLMLSEQKLEHLVCKDLDLEHISNTDLNEWEQLVNKIDTMSSEVVVGLVGKYVDLEDAYLSINESLYHAGYHQGRKVNIKFIDSETITAENSSEVLGGLHGILVPGGFGQRGIDGMIEACRFAREHNVPYFGICLGMQIMVIEFARNVVGLKDANSAELDSETINKVIDYMNGQSTGIDKGGTMRLGSYPCTVKEGTKLREIYGEELIQERHRHRLEFNNQYLEQFEAEGLTVSGTSPLNGLVEVVEYGDKDFHIGAQFHPEFKSRPNKPHPLFVGFIKSLETTEL